MIIICRGKSMFPTLSPFSILRIQKSDSYKIGDVIALRTHDGKNHCHRILSIDNEYVTTKGDNLEIQPYEIEVPINNILGKMTWSFPK